MRTHLALVAALGLSVVGCKSEEEPTKTARTWTCADVAIYGGHTLRCTSAAVSYDGPVGGAGGAGGTSNGTTDGTTDTTTAGTSGAGGTGGTAGNGSTNGTTNGGATTGGTEGTGGAGGATGNASSNGTTDGTTVGSTGGAGGSHYECTAGAADCPPANAKPGTNDSNATSDGTSDGTSTHGPNGGGASSSDDGDRTGGSGGGGGSDDDGDDGDDDGAGSSSGSSGSSGPGTSDGPTGGNGTGGGSGEKYDCTKTGDQIDCKKKDATCVPGATPSNGGCIPSGSGSGSGGSTGAGPGCGLFLVIDEDSIDNGNPPNHFSDRDVNDHIAEIGLRAQLPYFASHPGEVIKLHTGQVGDEGWFAPKVIPASWAAAGPTSNGVTNFVGAPVGPGLGTPDAKGDREALLDKIPFVTPLRARGLKALVGKKVCAVVYDSDVSVNYAPLNGNLKGANLGTVAFEVLTVSKLNGYSTSSLPEVEIRILDAAQTCACATDLFVDAPEPVSSSLPMDVNP